MEDLVQYILKNINREDLTSEINEKIYKYINNLRTFLTRLFKICYNKPLSAFNTQPLEVLLYYVTQKKEDLKKCYPILEEDKIYLKLKEIPSQEDYEEMIELLALLGKEVETKYKFGENHTDFLNSLKLSNNIISPKKASISKVPEHNRKSKDKIITFFLLAVLILEVALIVYLIFNISQGGPSWTEKYPPTK